MNIILYHVFEVELSDDGESVMRWKKIEDLGDRAIFIGPYNSSISIKASVDDVFGVKPNCIYYIDPPCHFTLSPKAVTKVEIYNMRDRSMEVCSHVVQGDCSMWLF